MKVTVERAQLLKSLGHVHRVVERRNTIPILGNVLVRAENARLSLKATDLDLEVTETLAAETATGGSTTVPAHMLYDIARKLPDGAQIVLALPSGATGMPGVIVPRKTVGEVQRLIEDNEAEVKIELSQGKIRFTLGNVVLTSKLIDGTFPDYGRVIPQNNDKELIVD